MRHCDRCGEANHDAARYCGTCGQSMSPVDVSEPVVDDGIDPEDETGPGSGPGAAGLKTSEYVSAPTYGETAAVSAPAVPATPPTAPPSDVVASTAVVPPPGGPPPQQPPVTNGGSGLTAGAGGRSSSTGVMIAALAVAAVVIVGGVFILLSRGSGGTEVARTGEDPSVPPGTAAETLPAEPPVTATPGASAPADPVATMPLPPPTEPTPEPVSTAAPVSTVPPVAASTLPPEPAPTAPPAPTRGPGDLGLTQPILDEACDGRYITFVGSAVGERPYGVVVDELLDLYPGTNYVWTRACPSLRQEFSNGAEIYGVVFGPYATQQEACDARAFGPVDAYVRRISTFDPQDHTITC